MDYDKLRQISKVQLAGVGTELIKTGASFIPVLGTGIMAVDAYKNFKNGNLGSGLLDLGGAALSLIPGLGWLGGAAKAGRLAGKAAKLAGAANKAKNTGKAAAAATKGALSKAGAAVSKAASKIPGSTGVVEGVSNVANQVKSLAGATSKAIKTSVNNSALTRFGLNTAGKLRYGNNTKKLAAFEKLSNTKKMQRLNDQVVKPAVKKNIVPVTQFGIHYATDPDMELYVAQPYYGDYQYQQMYPGYNYMGIVEDDPYVNPEVMQVYSAS